MSKFYITDIILACVINLNVNVVWFWGSNELVSVLQMALFVRKPIHYYGLEL